MAALKPIISPHTKILNPVFSGIPSSISRIIYRLAKDYLRFERASQACAIDHAMHHNHLNKQNENPPYFLTPFPGRM
jgi:hypothetical protein